MTINNSARVVGRWLALPFYKVGTAITGVADWLDSEGWWTSR